MQVQAAELAAFPSIRHAFFTRQGGVSKGLYGSLNGGLGSADDPAQVAENRRRMAACQGVQPGGLVSLHQVHSAEAVVVEAPFRPHERPKADGMATRVPGLALAVTTADCGPLLLADPQSGVIGAAHAGWRGALSGIAEATLERMEQLGADRRRVVAVLGPTISQTAYEVGPDLIEQVRDREPEAERFFRPSERAGHARFDLPGLIGARLRRAGVAAFVDLGLCTYADPDRFFSYRRATHRGEPDYGRLIAAIALSP
jgi:YfiH family protein